MEIKQVEKKTRRRPYSNRRSDNASTQIISLFLPIFAADDRRIIDLPHMNLGIPQQTLIRFRGST